MDLDPKKGTKCHKMLDCGHIFCLQCLQDFYNDAIQEGNISAVRCLTPNCAKERASENYKGEKKRRKPKMSISPSELLQIGLSEDTVKRYVMLKYKTELESDKNTIYCPRYWCGGAARSKKHKKPSGLEFEEASDAESDQGDEEISEKAAENKGKTFELDELLAICEDCGFAFCSRCFQTWHGAFVSCAPKRNKDELTEEEKASLEYLELHTSPCPTCGAPAQKTHGCNHMICSRCDTHFCYLCSAWLDPANPYRHYNEAHDGKVTSCFMRLWELEGGDGDDVGLGFAGGQVARVVLHHHLDEGEPVLVDEVINNEDFPRNNHRRRNQQLDENGRPIAVAREAPLVLRLVDDQPNDARAPAPAPAPAPPAPAAAGRGRNPPPRRGAAQRGRAARGRGARGGAHAARGRGRQANGAARGLAGGPARNANGGANGGLDANQEAWVRNFVQMALLDAEDEIEDELDGDDELFFRIR